MSRYTWLLDPGHGGIIDGVYQTAGKRSPEFEDGSVLYEGVFNRDVASRIIGLTSGIRPGRACNKAIKKADVINLVPTEEDVSLYKRVKLANEIHAERGNCIYVSIHANAFGNGREFNSAGGICTFHHYRSSKGKKLAQSLQTHLGKLTDFRDRGIRANDTWANFYVLRKTHMPAVLSENGFMTNLHDATLLMSQEIRQKVAHAHFEMILEIEKNGL